MNHHACAAIVSTTDDVGPARTIAVVADRRLSVAALAALLLQDPQYRLVFEARGITNVTEALAAYRPAVVVLDSLWRDSTATINTADWNGCILLLLDPEDDPAVFVQALHTHADGYLSRSAPRESLAQALVSVLKTGGYLDPLLVGRFLSAKGQAGTTSVRSRSGLSRRERDILVGIASGRSTKEVAREYAITPKTVGNHVNNIYRKLSLRHRGELVLYAVQQGLTTFAPATSATT